MMPRTRCAVSVNSLTTGVKWRTARSRRSYAAGGEFCAAKRRSVRRRSVGPVLVANETDAKQILSSVSVERIIIARTGQSGAATVRMPIGSQDFADRAVDELGTVDRTSPLPEFFGQSPTAQPLEAGVRHPLRSGFTRRLQKTEARDDSPIDRVPSSSYRCR